MLGFRGCLHELIHCWVLACPRCWGRKTNGGSFCKECTFLQLREDLENTFPRSVSACAVGSLTCPPSWRPSRLQCWPSLCLCAFIFRFFSWEILTVICFKLAF